MQETWVRSLGQEGPLEEEKTTHSSILAWKISWTEEPGLVHAIAKCQKYLGMHAPQTCGTRSPEAGAQRCVLTSCPVTLRFAKVKEQRKSLSLQRPLLLRVYLCPFLTSFSGNWQHSQQRNTKRLRGLVWGARRHCLKFKVFLP